MKTDQDIDQTFKSNFFMQVVLAGDHGVGKSFLLNRYVRQEIPSVVHPTIGVEFGIKVTKLPSGQKIKTHIWDTAG
jgi:Ras-related protein Rab-2A